MNKQKERPYDVFISYRRSSFESAQLIATNLKAAGYRVFIDVEALRGGKFNEQLYDVIDHCKDFLVILPENALERCVNPEDWVRKEICRALEKGKNIVPVMLAGFVWPETMPEGMEALKDYQALAATSKEYFDLAMIRLRKYLTSRSYARHRKILLVLGVILLCLALLALIAVPLVRRISLPFYTKVADNLTMQTSVVSLLEDTSDRLGDIWEDFYPDYQAASPREREHLMEELSMDLDRVGKEIDAFKVQVSPYQIAQFTPMEDLKLGLRGISSDDVLAAYPLCLSFFDDVENHIRYIREAVSDGDVLLEEDKTIRVNVDFNRHAANIFFYGYLDVMAKMPEKALANYKKLVTEWRNFPNGVGLGHSSEEYQQYIDRELNILRDYGRDVSKLLLSQEQELLDMQKVLDEQIAQYEALYQQTLTAVRIDTTRTPLENWNNIVILSSFLDEALENEKDPEGVDGMVTSARVIRDLEGALNGFAQAFPALKGVTSGVNAYYRGIADGKYPYGGLVVIGSMVPELLVGDIVTSMNGKKTIPSNYASLGDVVQANKIRALEILRLENGKLSPRKVSLADEQNMLVFWLVGMGE